jgi:hypothetical protein
MIARVLLLLLALNLLYLAFGLYRAYIADPYAGVPPMVPIRDAVELELIGASLEAEPSPNGEEAAPDAVD